MKKIVLSLVTAVTLATTLQGCGDEGRPSKDELVDQIGDQDVATGEQADCIAQALLDSDLSDKQLRAVADDDKSDISSDEEDEVIKVIGEAAGTCVTG